MVAINSWKWKNGMLENCSFVGKLKNNKYETNSNSIIARIHHFDSN